MINYIAEIYMGYVKILIVKNALFVLITIFNMEIKIVTEVKTLY
jgi:hypothetical protein